MWEDLGDWTLLLVMCFFSKIPNSRRLYPSGQEPSKQEHKVAQPKCSEVIQNSLGTSHLTRVGQDGNEKEGIELLPWRFSCSFKSSHPCSWLLSTLGETGLFQPSLFPSHRLLVEEVVRSPS